MYFKEIKLENFKSFDKLHIELNRFNVLIGPNAAGKSNFIHIFKFIRDIIENGLDNAISLQGGPNYIKNINLANNRKQLNLSFKIEPFVPYGVNRKIGGEEIELNLNSFTYSFTLSFSGSNYSIRRDRIDSDLTINNGDTKKLPIKLSISCGKSFKYILSGLKNSKYKAEELFPILPDMEKYLKEKRELTLMLESPFLHMFPFERVNEFLKKIKIYDFDSNLPKKAASFIGKAELEENGENLAIVLKRILEDNEKRRMLFNLVKDILPFIKEIKVEKIFNRYLQLMVKEEYSGKQQIPSSMMSDGTLFIINLIIAMYFEKNSSAIFEEPERRLHPNLISRVVEMMKDASYHKQIILSTHNPEAVKHSNIKDLLLVTRNQEGYSTLSKPHEALEIKTFLENEIGIEELYIQNMLGGSN